MTRRIPKDRSKAELHVNPEYAFAVNDTDDWGTFIRLKTKEKAGGLDREIFLEENFKEWVAHVRKHGREQLSPQCDLITCPVGRTPPGIASAVTANDPAVCVRLEIDHPSRPGTCRVCSGPYYPTERRDWLWRKREAIEHEPPERGCPHNPFEFEDADWEAIKTMVLDELVEKHPDYEEVEWEE